MLGRMAGLNGTWKCQDDSKLKTLSLKTDGSWCTVLEKCGAAHKKNLMLVPLIFSLDLNPSIPLSSLMGRERSNF